MKRSHWIIGRFGKHDYRLRDLKNHYVVDTNDGTELGWCRSIKLWRDSILSDSCWVEVKVYQDGVLHRCLYTLERFLDLAPTPAIYNYSRLVSDLYHARQSWLYGTDDMCDDRFYNYQHLAQWQPWLLEAAGIWSWAEYRQAIALHFLSTYGELGEQGA